jgi:hypothetical protein
MYPNKYNERKTARDRRQTQMHAGVLRAIGAGPAAATRTGRFFGARPRTNILPSLGLGAHVDFATAVHRDSDHYSVATGFVSPHSPKMIW